MWGVVRAKRSQLRSLPSGAVYELPESVCGAFERLRKRRVQVKLRKNETIMRRVGPF